MAQFSITSDGKLLTTRFLTSVVNVGAAGSCATQA